MRDMETDYHWNTRCFDCGREWKHDGPVVPYRCDCGSANIRSTRRAPAREDKATGARTSCEVCHGMLEPFDVSTRQNLCLQCWQTGRGGQFAAPVPRKVTR